MTKVEFNYKGNITTIQMNKDEKIKEILKKYADETKIDVNLVYFIYSGNIIINEELSFEEISNNEDKIRNKININAIEKNIISKEIIKPKEIICPKCNESIKMYIEDYNIFLYECKNGHKQIIYLLMNLKNLKI